LGAAEDRSTFRHDERQPMNSTIPLIVSLISGVAAVVFAQASGAETAIDMAAKHGYESVVLVLIVLTVFSLFTWAIRGWIQQAAERENRLSTRVTTLEDKITERLLTALDKSSEAIQQNSRGLENITAALGVLTAQITRLGDNLVRLEGKLTEHDERVPRLIEEAREVERKRNGAA
jgi:signal transduction histidine kinase